MAAPRAKLYELNASGTWDDKGTGHVFFETVGATNLVLKVISEDSKKQLLQHTVNHEVAEYARQGEKMITWYEDEEYVDYALSFQEAAGCESVWTEVHEHKTTDTNYEPLEGGKLPLPTLDNLYEIGVRVNDANVIQKEMMAQYIIDANYLRKLYDLFVQAEASDVSATKSNLFYIFDIVKGFFLLNDVDLLEFLINDFGCTLALLEYDSYCNVKAKTSDISASDTDNSTKTSVESSRTASPIKNDIEPAADKVITSTTSTKDDLRITSIITANKYTHRNFMKRAMFKQPIIVQDNEIIEKIHENFRLLYIKDTILPHYLDDNTQTTLNSMIFFNNIFLIEKLTDNDQFMNSLMSKLKAYSTKSFISSSSDVCICPPPNNNKLITADDNFVVAGCAIHDMPTRNKNDDIQRKDCFCLLQEMCNIAKNVSIIVKKGFYESLIDRDVFQIIDDTLVANALSESTNWLWVVCLDILKCSLDYEPSLLRSYLCSKIAVKRSLFQLLVECLVFQSPHCDTDGLAVQTGEILRLLLDQDTMKMNIVSVFFDAFYEKHLVFLMTHVTNQKKPARSYQPVYNVVDLLTHCIAQTQPDDRMSQFILRHNILEKVIGLVSRLHDNCDANLTSLDAIAEREDKQFYPFTQHVVAGVVRLVRACILLRYEQHIIRIVEKKLLDPLVDIFMYTGQRYNILNSVLLELFHFILASEDLVLDTLKEYMIIKHRSKFEKISYAPVFMTLIAEWEEVHGITTSSYAKRKPGQAFGANAAATSSEASNAKKRRKI